MNRYITHDASGNIVSCGISDGLIDQRISSDHTQLWMDFPADIENYKISDGKLVRISDEEIDDREETQAWALLRSVRDTRLAASDWTQVPDAPVDRLAWAEYRQALRDLPANTTDPRNPDWPVQPV